MKPEWEKIYKDLYESARVTNSSRVKVYTDKILAAKDRYQKVSNITQVPWQIIGVIHGLEGSFKFNTHLHNGDPLTSRTTHVPKGRPRSGVPPFSWEESAADALLSRSLPGDWSVEETLYFLECYNGLGYQKKYPKHLSPYIWASTNHETPGKYVADGKFDPKAISKQAGAAAILIQLGQKVVTEPKVETSDYFGAPWVGANIDLLGRSETDPELNARYVPEWKLEGLPGYKTLAGNRHAWCSLRENADKRKVGYKGTNSAGAASWSKWGKKCPFWFGATLDIKHAGGGRHVGDFLYWINEKKKIAAVLGGNQKNLFSIASTNLSGGKYDELVTGPRWPIDCPDGQIVSMKDVLDKYPHLKVTGKSGSTT